jgi:multidrug efflux pump subunit AcrA (membrane-fusion protein)
MESAMKGISIVLALAAGASTISCYAASAPAPTSVQPTPTTQVGDWAPQYGVKVQPKTRAQVYQELVHAERDGQLQRLDRTLYWHG